MIILLANNVKDLGLHSSQTRPIELSTTDHQLSAQNSLKNFYTLPSVHVLPPATKKKSASAIIITVHVSV